MLAVVLALAVVFVRGVFFLLGVVLLRLLQARLET